jgi:osmotically-inducible protein OsmY
MAIITISRGTYSGGKAVAEKLAQRLNHPCLSRELIIQKATQIFALKEGQLTDAMEEAPTIFRGDVPISTANVNFVRAALLQQIENLELVYHGLAGDLLLRGVKKMLRVRTIASREYRINAAMEDHNIDLAHATEMVDTLDRKRDKWAIEVLGTEWSDPSLYDVAINLDSISVDSAVDTIAQMSRLDEFTVDETTTSSLDDLILSSNVWAALTMNRPTRAVQVQITADDGHVAIHGEVGSRKVSEAIIDIARNVNGVKEVTDNLRVGLAWVW